MPTFLNLKSYLTTNRSNITKQETIKSRRLVLSKSELLRERVADKLKCSVCFCAPCFIVAFSMIIVLILYVLIPYRQALQFQRVICTVKRIEFTKKGSCSYGTEQFQPCYKIIVTYNNSNEERSAVLMENEQTMYHCKKCSYTFGKGELFTKTCKKPPSSCVLKYNKEYGQINSKYECFHNPNHPNDVFRTFKTSEDVLIYEMLLPVLIVLFSITGFLFLRYDNNRRRTTNAQLKSRRKGTGASRDVTSYSKSPNHLTSEHYSSSGSTIGVHRVRKKELPCTKIHTFSSRDEEDVILEEKPISRAHVIKCDRVMQVRVDNLVSSKCECVIPSSEHGFELRKIKEHFTPVMSNQFHHNQKYHHNALRYLPETIV